MRYNLCKKVCESWEQNILVGVELTAALSHVFTYVMMMVMTHRKA